MEVEISDEDENGDFALTIARLTLQARRGGRGEHSEAGYKMEAAMAWWSRR